MSPGEDKAKRWRIWRPRFSVRTLAIFLTLVCVYFGAWEATKRYGVAKVEAMMIKPASLLGSSSSPVPCVIRVELIEPQDELLWQTARYSSGTLYTGAVAVRKRYYLWLFGPTIKLPFELTW